MRSHDRGDALEDLAPKPDALGRKAPALLVRQAEPAIPDLLTQDPVLLDQVLNHPLLLPVHPA